MQKLRVESDKIENLEPSIGIERWTSVAGTLKLQVQYRQHVTVINCYLNITCRIESLIRFLRKWT